MTIRRNKINCPLLSEQEIVALGFVISLANFWNRMAGGFRK